MDTCFKHLKLKKTVFIFIFLSLAYVSFAQKADSLKNENHFYVAATVTNYGISFIPTFTLGKPAAIFDLSIGRRLTFDPQLRFSLEGKPWSFLFWFHYKLVENNKFLLRIGAHPALSFRNITLSTDELPEKTIVARRYLAAELAPVYSLTRNINVGVTYMYSRCLEPDAARNTHYLTLNSTFSNIAVAKELFIRVNPQLYYLRTDKNEGYFFSSGLNISKRNFPLSVSALINKTIKSHVPGSKDFLWNVSLVYAFNGKFRKLPG
jgi:hypothetical protein